MASDYPGAVDSFTTKVDDQTDVLAEHVNSLQDSVVAVETELGTDPAGSEATVKDRLGNGSYLSSVSVYTANDTWSKPSNLAFIIVEVQASGGGGGGVAGDAVGAGSGNGGGGGEYAKKFILAAALGATEAVTVGAAGAAGTAGNNIGGNGNTSSFGAHATTGGGAGGNGQLASPSVPTTGSGGGGAGGTGGSGGDLHIDGGAPVYGFANSITAVQSSKGGGSHLGGMISLTAGAGTDEAGATGVSYGGGGCGARSSSDATDRAGGAGAPGVVIVTEYLQL